MPIGVPVPCRLTGGLRISGGSPPESSNTTVAFLMRRSDLFPGSWERMDERGIDRGDTGALGRIVAGGKGADAPVVHAGAGSGIGGSVSGWAAGAGAAQDRLDAGRGSG